MAEALRIRMEYWKDGNWYVGRFPQVPGVFSQGATHAPPQFFKEFH